MNPLASNPSSSLVVITLDSDSKGPWIEPRLRHFPQRTGYMEVLPGSGTKGKSDLTAPAGWRQDDGNPARKEYPQIQREQTPLEPPSGSWEGSVGAGSVGIDRGRRKSPGSYSERPWGRLVNPLASNPSSSLVVITSDSDSKGS